MESQGADRHRIWMLTLIRGHISAWSSHLIIDSWETLRSWWDDRIMFTAESRQDLGHVHGKDHDSVNRSCDATNTLLIQAIALSACTATLIQIPDCLCLIRVILWLQRENDLNIWGTTLFQATSSKKQKHRSANVGSNLPPTLCLIIRSLSTDEDNDMKL
jgi:hypothetical protein